MWIQVYRASDGQRITNATFTVAAYNNGDGWYYMYIGPATSFCVSASGYNTVCGNTDYYSWMWAALTPVQSTGSSNCWS